MTNDQTRALEFLDSYFATCKRGVSSFASLQGYAGVGKTWLIAYWVERLLEKRPGLRITIVAPTNKAVDVLRSKCGHLPVRFCTLDSYLGFRIKRDEDAQMQRSRATKAANGDDDVDLLICDEGSMVKEEYHKELGWRKVPVLYVLDPAQLQPVGEELSPSALVPNRCLMTEVVRQQAGNPIIDLATFLRDRVNDNRMFTLPDIRQFAKADDRRIAFTNYRNIHDWADAAADKGMDSRILAFTNAAVADNNRIMHARRHPDSPLFGAGELALVNEAFEYDDETLLCNGELLRVAGCEEVEPIAQGTHIVGYGSAGVRTFEVKAFGLKNSLEVNGELQERELTFKAALDPVEAMRAHRALTDEIYRLRREGAMREADKLFDLRRPLNKLAPLRHSYSCTVHKSQGSTYDTAFLDFPDIYRSRDMRARLLYVAATRPSEYLVIAHSGG